jgi:hypothetical protein
VCVPIRFRNRSHGCRPYPRAEGGPYHPDLAGAEALGKPHIAEALSYRRIALL